MKLFLTSILIASSLCVCVSAQKESSRYIKDQRSGCLVWDKNYSEEDSVLWDGPCVNGRASGLGTLRWYNAGELLSSYRGQMRDGKAHGAGVLSLDNNRQLRGMFVEGEFLDIANELRPHLVKNHIELVDKDEYYVNDGGSTELFYYSLVPDKCKAVLVLFPCTWENVEHTISSNKDLMARAYRAGIACIVPSLNQRLLLTAFNIEFINQVFDSAIKRYSLPSDKFILSGLSMGGIMSFRYTELSRQDPKQTRVVPIAAMNVDGPVNLEYLHTKLSRDLENPRNNNRHEARYALKELQQWVGENITTDGYDSLSVYTHRRPDGGNARFLKDTPVRIYNDVDVNWWIEHRGNDLYEMNALDQSAMINLLIGMGNTRAEFINAYQKGKRIEGNRHPHSWSLVDPAECIRWISKIVDAQQSKH